MREERFCSPFQISPTHLATDQVLVSLFARQGGALGEFHPFCSVFASDTLTLAIRPATSCHYHATGHTSIDVVARRRFMRKAGSTASQL